MATIGTVGPKDEKNPNNRSIVSVSTLQELVSSTKTFNSLMLVDEQFLRRHQSLPSAAVFSFPLLAAGEEKMS